MTARVVGRIGRKETISPGISDDEIAAMKDPKRHAFRASRLGGIPGDLGCCSCGRERAAHAYTNEDGARRKVSR